MSHANRVRLGRPGMCIEGTETLGQGSGVERDRWEFGLYVLREGYRDFVGMGFVIN